MATGREIESQRKLECPFRVAQAKLSRPFTCGGCQAAKNMADIRRHCTRNLRGKRPPHLFVLKLCPTCNEDFLQETEYNRNHGVDGLKCGTPRGQRKGDAGQQEQWETLCVKVEKYILAEDEEQRT
jgi:hypothetical protein